LSCLTNCRDLGAHVARQASVALGRADVASRRHEASRHDSRAGFAGLELATRLSETAADAVRVTLLDRNDAFHFGFSKLEVMLGRETADSVRLPYSDIAKESVEFRQETVLGIDPVARRVSTDVAVHEADILVVAMGADYDFAATPGFEDGGHEYYTLAGAERLCDALADFRGGSCPRFVLGPAVQVSPAPFEGSFLLHEHFTRQGIRDAVADGHAVSDAAPGPGHGDVSQMFRDALAARDIEELRSTL
jgi:sulfide:quinone oxidoreductase